MRFYLRILWQVSIDNISSLWHPTCDVDIVKRSGDAHVLLLSERQAMWTQDRLKILVLRRDLRSGSESGPSRSLLAGTLVSDTKHSLPEHLVEYSGSYFLLR